MTGLMSPTCPSAGHAARRAMVGRANDATPLFGASVDEGNRGQRLRWMTFTAICWCAILLRTDGSLTPDQIAVATAINTGNQLPVGKI